MKSFSLSKLTKNSSNWDENHSLTDLLTRYTTDNNEYHIAVHDFDVIGAPKEYSQLHSHSNEDEINIMFSNHPFQVKLIAGKDELIITKNAIANIPAGMKHSANVIKGKGIFICIRFATKP